MAARNVVEVEFRVVGDVSGAKNVVNEVKATAAGLAAPLSAFQLETQKMLASLGASLSGPTKAGLTALRLETEAFAAAAGGPAANSLNLLSKEVLSSASSLAQLLARMGILPGSFASTASGVATLSSRLGPLGIAAAAGAAELLAVGLAVKAVITGFEDFIALAQRTVPEAEKLRTALLGLTNAASFQGVSPVAAAEVVRNLDLVKSGLLGVAEASTALGNLLSAGFSLGQATTLLQRFGDQAAFGKAANETFGQAVLKSTETLKGQADKLSDATKRHEAYADALNKTANDQGNAAKFADGYAGSLTKIGTGYTAILQKIGDVIENNAAINRILEFTADTLDAVNANWATLSAELSGTLVPALQLTLILLEPVELALLAVAKAVGLTIQGIAALKQLQGLGDASENEGLAKLGKDLSDLATKGTQLAITLPLDIGKVREAVKSVSPEGVGAFSGKAFTGSAQQLLEVSKLLTDVDKQRAAIGKAEADAIDLRTAALSKTLDLSRELERVEAASAIIAAGRGKNPLAVQFDTELGKIRAASDERIAQEADRIAGLRDKLLEQIRVEQEKAVPSSPLLDVLRSSLTDLDASTEAFSVTNDKLTVAQEKALKVDFAGKFATQLRERAKEREAEIDKEIKAVNDQAALLQAANRQIFDVAASILGDNPYVQLFRSSAAAADEFGTRMQGNTEIIRRFNEVAAEALDRQTQKLDAAQSIRLFDITGQESAFRAATGRDAALSGEDQNRLIFEEFERLKLLGIEGERIANKFLTDKAASGQLIAKDLIGGQEGAVLDAFRGLQENMVSQKAEAQALTALEDAKRETIRTKAEADAKALFKQKEEEIKALNRHAAAIEKLPAIARIDVVAGPNTTVDATPSGTLP